MVTTSLRFHILPQRLYECWAPEDSLVCSEVLPSSAESLDTGPASRTPDKPTPLEVGAATLGDSGDHEAPVASASIL